MKTTTTIHHEISRRLCYPRPIHILCVLLVIIGIQTSRMNGLRGSSFEKFLLNITTSSNDTSSVAVELDAAIDKKKAQAFDDMAQVDGKYDAYSRLSLAELMRISSTSSSVTCEQNTRHITATGSVSAKQSAATRAISFRGKSRIPNIIHQMDISPCLPDNLYKAAESWKNLSGYEYCFHTNSTMQALLDQDWPEFPHLLSISSCIPSYEGIINLWKALCLWEFGGAVVDLDILPLDHFGELFVDSNSSQEAILFSWTKRRYLKLSAELVVMEPKHPIAYYWVMHTLNGIVRLKSMVDVSWGEVTGLPPLDNAWWYFVCTDIGGKKKKPETWEEYQGLKQGRYNRTAALLKLEKYTKKGDLDGNWRLKHYPKVVDVKKWNRTCMSVLYDVLAGPSEITDKTPNLH